MTDCKFSIFGVLQSPATKIDTFLPISHFSALVWQNSDVASLVRAKSHFGEFAPDALLHQYAVGV